MAAILKTISDADGNRWKLGHRPTPPALRAEVPNYRDTVKLIDEADLPEFNDWPDDELPALDQNGWGACNAYATAQCAMAVRWAAGMTKVALDPLPFYGQMTGGWDVGSNIGTALKLATEKGIPPAGINPAKNINPRKIPADAWVQAKRFRFEIGAMLTTAAEIWTAVARRELLNLSVTAGARFSNLDGEGVPGLGLGMNNHAVCVGLGLKKSKNRGPLVLMTNSWTKSYGQNGHCWLPVKQVVTYPGFECLVLKAVLDDPQDPDRPPQL